MTAATAKKDTTGKRSQAKSGTVNPKTGELEIEGATTGPQLAKPEEEEKPEEPSEVPYPPDPNARGAKTAAIKIARQNHPDLGDAKIVAVLKDLGFEVAASQVFAVRKKEEEAKAGTTTEPAKRGRPATQPAKKTTPGGALTLGEVKAAQDLVRRLGGSEALALVRALVGE